MADSLLKKNSCGPDVAMKELHLADTKADLNTLLGLATKFEMKELKTRCSMLCTMNLVCVCVCFMYNLHIQHNVCTDWRVSKPIILVRPKLELKFQSQLSDLSLISEEGESIPCHRCILVARSGSCMHHYTCISFEFVSFILL